MKELEFKDGTRTLVDDEDADLLGSYGWYPLKDGKRVYAYANTRTPEGKATTAKLHRLVAARMFGEEAIVRRRVDHVNNEGLDNRRKNLRMAGAGQNAVNSPKRAGQYSSKYKGAYLHKPSGRYLAQIRIDGERRSLGYFDTQEQAAVAYDRAAMERYDDFEQLNFRWKTCPGCDELKPEIDFAIRPNRGSGRASQCKVCVAAAKRAR